MKRSSLAAIVFLQVFIGACTYNETGYYYVDPDPGEPPLFSVATNLDTIVDPRVTDSMEVIYEVEIENSEFYQAEAYLQDFLIYNSDTIRGSFWIDTGDVPAPGVDTLSIWFYYSTNSNTLADILGVEFSTRNLKYGIIFEGGGVK